jgi:hypothetical protein
MAENPRIEELRRRVQADPASIAFAALAEEFRRVGRYDEAIEACRTGLQRHPAYLSARVTLGRALIEMGDFEGAQAELQTVLRTAPENLAAIRGLAQIHERLGHSQEMDPALAALHAEPIPSREAPAPPAPPPAPEPIVPTAVREAEPAASLDTAEPAESAIDFPFQQRREAAPEIGFDFPSAPPKEKPPAAPVEPPQASRRIDPFAAFVATPAETEPVPSLTPIPIRMPDRLPTPVVAHPQPPPEPAADAPPESALSGDSSSEASAFDLAPIQARDIQPGAAFDLESSSVGEIESEPAFDLEPAAAPEPAHHPTFDLEAAAAELLLSESAFPGEPDAAVDAISFDLAPMPAAEPPVAFDPEPEPDLTDLPEAGPDPEVIATLARLEQFLAAIQLARHA